MKIKAKHLAVFFLLSTLVSCKEYETKVINRINSDGSVDRTLIIQTDSDDFDPTQCQVPVDSSWNISAEMIIKDQDTSWTYTAQKHFPDMETVNKEYEHVDNVNSHLERSSSFEKYTYWFVHDHVFKLEVNSLLDIEDPGLKNYLTEAEIKFFDYPEVIRNQLIDGPDSLIYKTLSDSLELHFEQYSSRCIYTQWMAYVDALVMERFPDGKYKASLKIGLDRLLYHSDRFGLESDLSEDSVLVALFGQEFANECKHELDSATVLLEDKLNLYLEAESYELEVHLPGPVKLSDGYYQSGDSTVRWTITPDAFLAGDHTYMAFTRSPNIWAHVITWSFLVFVLSGLVIYRRRKKQA